MPLLLAPLRWAISSIIRLAILLAVLVVAYLALLKPAIDSGEKRVGHTLHSLETRANPKRLAHCVQHADGNLDKMKRCARVF